MDRSPKSFIHRFIIRLVLASTGGYIIETDPDGEFTNHISDCENGCIFVIVLDFYE
jgi:hypothetical protein